jgi:hypothetical protein
MERDQHQDRGRIRAHYDLLCRDLADQADIAALLLSLKHYIPFI